MCADPEHQKQDRSTDPDEKANDGTKRSEEDTAQAKDSDASADDSTGGDDTDTGNEAAEEIAEDVSGEPRADMRDIIASTVQVFP
jgi:hypothetical protein